MSDGGAILEEVEERVETVNDAVDTYLGLRDDVRVHRAADYLVSAGGKRLRPVVLLLVAESFDGDRDAVLPAAVAVEATHSFTLIHDDIMDDDPLRRGVPSVHVNWDDSTAILAGDFLHSKAFETLLGSEAPSSTLNRALGVLAASCTRLCEGQSLDIELEHDDGRATEEEYVEMIEKKTASLFSASAEIGAVLGFGATDAEDEAVRGARRYGTKLGKAFQIHDDVLDLVSEPGKTGKARASDLIEGKTTLVSIHARRQGVETRLPDDASPDEIDEKIEEIRDAGSIEYARERARRLADESKRELASLPEGEARDLLGEIADYAVEREN